MTDEPTDPHSIDLLIRSDNAIKHNHKQQRRHSSAVRVMRLVLPVAALAVVAVLITWKNDNAPVTPIPREKISPQTVTQNELIKPKFQSEDSSNQPYTITADKATQNTDDMDAVILDNPVADMTLTSGDTVSIKAVNGTYRQSAKILSLRGDIAVTHHGGYDIHTEALDIDVAGQTITSNQPVTATSPTARIESSGLTVDGAAKIITFTGHTTLTLKKENQGQQHE